MITDNYTDIHSHILFGVDDGAASLEESLGMLALAHQEGIRTMFATPHYGSENVGAAPFNQIRANFQQLQDAAAQAFPDLRLLLGSELYCVPDKVLGRVERGEALSMAGTRYLLMEFAEWGSKSESAEHICDSMIAIAQTDWLPILAHAQRYRGFDGKRHLYERMVAAEVCLQINAYDLEDTTTTWTKENTRWLVQNRLAHFIGTDAHGVVRRPPVMRSGVQYLYAHCDEAYVDALVFGNAEKLIAGEEVPL